MIITAPTALYESLLPKLPSDVGNVTWTISSNDAPRASQTIPQLTQVDEYKSLPPMPYNPSCREIGVGAYIFDLSYTLSTTPGSGKKQYEAGQLIDFTQETLPVINDLLVPESVELQQNTNLLELSQYGLSEEEILSLDQSARGSMNEAIDTLNVTKATINSLTVQISDNQKSINEVRKALSAASLLFDMEDPIIKKLTEKQYTLVAQRDQLAKDINAANTKANNTYNLIQSLREVVR